VIIHDFTDKLLLSLDYSKDLVYNVTVCLIIKHINAKETGFACSAEVKEL
jgi:hypothetical protein